MYVLQDATEGVLFMGRGTWKRRTGKVYKEERRELLVRRCFIDDSGSDGVFRLERREGELDGEGAGKGRVQVRVGGRRGVGG